MIFQLLISLRKINKRPKRLRKTAKLETTADKKVTIADEVSITCFSFELMHESK